jgi:hypothetical protein
MNNPPKTAIIACGVLDSEIEHYAKGLPNIVHLEFLRQGLHNDPPKLRNELQVAIDRVEAEVPQADHIVLGYGLCSRGTENVTAKRCTLVMTRAHDCITLLLGSKEKYADYVAKHPGTYWYSPGWNKYHTPPGKERYDKLYSQYVEQYGQDNAEFLMETEQHWFTTYDRATYVDLGVAATEADLAYTKGCADWLKWNYDRQHGNPELLCTLLSGPWDEERFVIVPPGQTIRMTSDSRVCETCKFSKHGECDGHA